ncbi:MAG TPA: hypothetical protein VMV94_00505 [Phycisphaerae bacterium]|nr:hypothetical protein [Phycisphaerae bacterium]
MRLRTKILRLLIAAGVGAGIGLLLYLLLLQWEHWTFERRVSRWMAEVVGAVLFCVFYYGTAFLIRRAKQ